MSLTPTPVAGGGGLPGSYYFALKNDPGLAQTLSLAGNTLSISNGNSVNIADATTVSTSAVKLTAQSYVAGFNTTNFTGDVRSEGRVISAPPLGFGSASLNGGQGQVVVGATLGTPKVVFEKSPAPNAYIDYDGTNINVSSLHVSTLKADTALLSTVQLGYEVLDSFGSPGAAGQQLQSSGPGLPVVWGAGSGVGLTAVVAGSNIEVDNTNPIAPIVNLSTSISIPSSVTCSTINGINPSMSIIASDSVVLTTPNTVMGVNETALTAYTFAPNEIHLSTSTFNLIGSDSNSVSFNLGNFAVIGSAQVGGSGIDGILNITDAANAAAVEIKNDGAGNLYITAPAGTGTTTLESSLSDNKLTQTATETQVVGNVNAGQPAKLTFYDNFTSYGHSLTYDPVTPSIYSDVAQFRVQTGAVEGCEIGTDTMSNWVAGMGGLPFIVAQAEYDLTSNAIQMDSGNTLVTAQSSINLSTVSITSYASTFQLNSDDVSVISINPTALNTVGTVKYSTDYHTAFQIFSGTEAYAHTFSIPTVSNNYVELPIITSSNLGIQYQILNISVHDLEVIVAENIYSSTGGSIGTIALLPYGNCHIFTAIDVGGGSYAWTMI